ncbi:hypothetical protein niasHS_003504 [Heterodera schachtii]|uniref:Uncharacterized protein n=1 Tax=Heterodera schachtii TaxID=97005 RepID=A0ABD2KGP8_HETSC
MRECQRISAEGAEEKMAPLDEGPKGPPIELARAGSGRKCVGTDVPHAERAAARVFVFRMEPKRPENVTAEANRLSQRRGGNLRAKQNAAEMFAELTRKEGEASGRGDSLGILLPVHFQRVK